MWKFLWKRYIYLRRIPSSWKKPNARFHCCNATSISKVLSVTNWCEKHAWKRAISQKGRPKWAKHVHCSCHCHKIKAFNIRKNGKGGKWFLQTYEQNGKSEQPLIIEICTPLLSRVHQLKQAGEMAFLDASGTLGRFCHHVYFMCTHHPAGALPPGVWITSGQSQHVIRPQCLEKVQNALSPHAFGGRGTKTGPGIFWLIMTLDKRGALLNTWKEVIHCSILSNSCKLSGAGYLNTATT